MKLTKTQTTNLKAIWTTKVAYGAQTETGISRLTKGQAGAIGYTTINSNALYSLTTKGLVQSFLTKDEVLGYRVRVAVLTDLGRAALGL